MSVYISVNVSQYFPGKPEWFISIAWGPAGHTKTHIIRGFSTEKLALEVAKTLKQVAYSSWAEGESPYGE